MIHYYAVKYLDENGFPYSVGYVETLDTLQPGQIITQNRQRILIEFELSDKTPKPAVMAIL